MADYGRLARSVGRGLRTARLIRPTKSRSIRRNAARIRRPPDQLLARIQELEIVDDERVVRLALEGLEKFLARRGQVAAQHKRIPFVVEDLRGLAGEANRRAI